MMKDMFNSNLIVQHIANIHKNIESKTELASMKQDRYCKKPRQ